MKIIVTGATGLVGAEVVRQAMLDNDIQEISALVRRPLDIPHLPAQGGVKLKVVIHKNFLDYDPLSELFKTHDACLWCLGISQNQVNKEEYHTITYDYAMEAAKAMLRANPSITFLFLSGEGADSSEKSKTLFARVKGKTENALQKLPFKKLIIARPGGIRPIHQNPHAPWTNKIMIPLFPVFELLMPRMVISSVQLAKALLYLVKNGADKIILPNPDLKQIFQKVQATR
jgi:uncharacterized protein YbjT (DUF2867 family)